MRNFLSLLTTMRPRTGRLIAEDGQAVNIADFERFREANSTTRRIIEGDAVRFSARRRNIDQDVYWFGVDVPAGKALVVIDDLVKLTENDYDLDIFRAPDGFTGGTEATKACLCEAGDPAVMGAQVWMGVTPANPATHVLRLEDFLYSGAGIGRSSVAPSTGGEAELHVFTETTLMRVTRVSGGNPFNLSCRLLAWEVDAI